MTQIPPVLIVIPARAGSKGVPNKNFKQLGDKPLIAHAINCCQQMKTAHRLIVSTDSPKIAEIAKEYGAEVPFMRPDDLATDFISIIPVVQHAYEAMRDLGYDAEIVISVQPTCPFLLPSDIDEGIQMLLEKGFDSVTSVKEIVHGHPYRAKKVLDGQLFDLFPEIKGDRFLQRQDLPVTYAYSGALYIRRREVLMGWSQKDFGLGDKVGAVVIPPERGVNIDTPMDFEMARLMI